MTPDDAAELGVYAADLFRYVTEAQRTTVAEMMLPILDVKDENGDVMQDALDVGRGILRSLAASAGEEQRLSMSDLNAVIRTHMRLHGYLPPDPLPNKWKFDPQAEAQARAYEDSTHKWAWELPVEEVEILTAEALKSIQPHAHFLFKNKDIRTSKTLRVLAHDYFRKLSAFH